MSQHALMEKPGEGQMYVPAGKRAEYELNGWKVIELPSAQISSAAVEDVEPAPASEGAEKKTRKSTK
jgi:hypothetical protein